VGAYPERDGRFVVLIPTVERELEDRPPQP
jgi:hypothetical protein